MKTWEEHESSTERKADTYKHLISENVLRYEKSQKNVKFEEDELIHKYLPVQIIKICVGMQTTNAGTDGIR